MRVLFASPYRPFPLVGGVDPLDPFTGQLSPTQGPFAMTPHSHYFAFYFMAENLNVESCVLEHPTMEEFEREVRLGYDVLGLQVNWNTLCKTAEMIERARVLAPSMRIVVGGYAVAQVLDPLPADEAVADAIRTGAHYLCREEGVHFMRRLLGDHPLYRPMKQFTLPKSRVHLTALGPAAQMMFAHPVLVALGCPAGCDFCNTSAFFKQRKLQIAEPDEVYAFMRHHLVTDRVPRSVFELFDEDLYWDPDYPRALGKRLREDPLTCGRVSYCASGTVRTLSRLDPEELVADGLDTVSIGVESTLNDVLHPGTHMSKRRGRDIQALFRDLHEVGIRTVGSLILGFDFHTPENICQDIEAFIALEPTIAEVTPLVPCAGTRLYNRMKKLGRLNREFGWTAAGGFRAYPPMAPLHFTWEELQRSIEQANRRLYMETGPSVLKETDARLCGYLRLRGHKNPAVRARAQAMGGVAKLYYPMIEAIMANAPSERVRDKARALRERWQEAFGEPEDEMIAAGRFLAKHIRRYAENPPPPPDVIDPPTRWTYYRPGSAPEVIKEVAA